MADIEIDCQGLNCPVRIVRISQKMKTMEPGQTLEVTASDLAFGADLRASVTKMGHRFLSLKEAAVQKATVRKCQPEEGAGT